jgi:hypothetical protein
MDSINFYKIVKWVLLVLIVGFIGQSGKYFATYLIEQARKKKRDGALAMNKDSTDAFGGKSSRAEFLDENRIDAKANKKTMKVFLKMKKKGK